MTIKMADRLIALRRAKGLSQREVAKQLGVTRQAVSKWERAEASPDTDNLLALMALYGVTLEDLMPSEKKPAQTMAVSNRRQKARGEKLRSLRETHGMTVAGLAAALNVPEETFAAWESGDVSPSPEEWSAVAAAIGVSTEELTDAVYMPRLNFGQMDGDTLSAEEKAAMVAAYEQGSHRRYRRGRAIVRTVIAIDSMWMLVVLFLRVFTADLSGTAESVLGIAINIPFYVLLWRGKPWVRYYYVVQRAVAVFMYLMLLGQAGSSPHTVYISEMGTVTYPEPFPWWLIGFIVVLIAYCVATAVLFFANRSVKEFLYAQHAG